MGLSFTNRMKGEMNTIRGLCHSIKILMKLKNCAILQYLVTNENIILELGYLNLQIINKAKVCAAITTSSILVGCYFMPILLPFVSKDLNQLKA